MHNLLSIIYLYLAFGVGFTLFEFRKLLADADSTMREVADEIHIGLAGHPIEEVEKILRRMYWATIAMFVVLKTVKWLPILIKRLRRAKGGEDVH